MKQQRCRRGLALLVVLVALAVVSLVMGGITLQIVAQRRQLDLGEQRAQALWLARSGLEIGIARLLAGPAESKDEVVQLLPASEVKLTIQPVKDAADTFAITSVARYPTDLPRGGVSRTLTRRVRRVVEKDGVRLEVVRVDDDAPK